MVLRAGLEPARIAPHAPQTCAATNYATSAVLFPKNYLFAGASVFAGAEVFAAAFAFEFAAGSATLALVSAGAEVFELSMAVFASVFAGASAGASGFVLRTETLPVNAGIASSNAESMKTDAAPIVILERTVAVPLGLKAELETLLVNRAPASVLPGCNRTAATSTMHDRKNNPYKK
jgi:hypothetical protein